MGIGSGLSAQLMYKSETTVGTGVTPDKGLEFISEAVKNDGGTRYESKGIRAGRLTKVRAARGVVHIAGPIVMELPNVNIAPMLKHAFGAVATTGSGPYVHTLTPGDLTGKSFTAQVGRPSNDGTVQPFTWSGGKISEWEMAASLNDYVKFTPTISAKSESVATALATATYASGLLPFTFVQASLTIAASAVAVSAFTLKGNNGLKLDRDMLGSATIKEQIPVEQRDYSGTINAEFESLTHRNHFIAADQVALVFTFSNGTDSLIITTNAELTGESPVVAGPGILEQPLPFSCLSLTSDAAVITAVLTNTDTVAT